jgi:hypothetical protein
MSSALTTCRNVMVSWTRLIGHTCWSDSSVTGTNPDYPTYVAIKGTVFDVTGNKAYGPEGSYKGKPRVAASLACQAPLNHSDSRLSSLRSAVPIGLIYRTSTRKCSTTGLPSSASVTTSKARWKAPRTHNAGGSLLTSDHEFDSLRG